MREKRSDMRRQDMQQREFRRKEKEKRRKEKSITRTDIRVVSWFFVLLFCGMIAFVWYYISSHRVEMMNNSYNDSQKILMTENSRGAIYSEKGEVLAEASKDKTGSETRLYPYNNTFAHVVGYAEKGMAGVESIANYYLLQSSIPISERIGNAQIKQKNPGDDVYTTLNVALQKAAFDAMGVYRGAVIVTQPKTGKVLAMVSKPDFDPNQINAQWEDLSADTETSALLNRATQGLYPPGSTFKIVTALEYIRENPDTWNDYSFNCKGSVTIDGTKISCYHGSHHGKVDLTKSFAKSCNSSFANISTLLNWDTMGSTSQQLLFGKTLPFSMKTSVSSMMTDSSMTTEDKMQTGIGQGTTVVTPMLMNLITCSIANGGVLQHPYILNKVVSHDGDVVKTFTSDGTETLMSAQEAQTLTDLMKQVVQEGTASKLKGLSYTAAGKTGSAEFDRESDSHAWFTGFAPADDPQLCVTVIIEGAGSGGDVAVPIAKDVFDAWFEQ